MDGHQCSSNGGGSRGSSFLCRQSTSRWIPTADQIRILRELYYINGVRSPTAEQIQRISARLRQYGKIEGKNVFYWFQNHKARERQKKKLTMDINNSTTNNINNNNVDDNTTTCNITHDNNNNNNKLTNTNTIHVPYGLAATSPGLYDVGNGYAGGAPVFMERSIRESCFSAGGGDGSVVDSNMASWVDIEPAMPWMYHYIKEEGEPISAAAVATATTTREIETLPLFPTHSQDQEEEEDQEEYQEQEQHKDYSSCHDYYTQQSNGYLPAACYWATGGQTTQENYHHHYTANGAAASLELTLNSYCPGSL